MTEQGAPPGRGVPRYDPTTKYLFDRDPAFWLAGLRYTEEGSRPLFEGVRAMRDSATYQAVLAEGEARGRVEGAREVVLRLGELRFGPPPTRTRRALQAIDDFERLERLGERLLTTASWDDLLVAP